MVEMTSVVATVYKNDSLKHRFPGEDGEVWW